MASTPWTRMRNPSDDAIPGQRGVFAVLLGPPIVEGPRHFVHLSWQGTDFVLRDYLNGVSRKQGDDLSLAALWRSATVRIPCKGRLRRSVEDHAFWEAELRRLTEESGDADGRGRGDLDADAGAGPRPIGLARGTFEIPGDFDAPLPDELLEAFRGEGP